MKKQVLGKTKLNVSVIGFGGIPIQGVSPSEASCVLNKALDCGINFIDTARGYTDSEIKIGSALKGQRNEFIIASKSFARDAKNITEDLETSLRNLQTDVIDIYQLHAVGSDEQLNQIMDSGGAYEALQKAKQAGKIKFIGITGHSRPVLQKAIETKAFDTIQHPTNPIEIEWLKEILPAAKKQNMGIIGMKPVAGGALKNVAAAFRFSLNMGVDVIIPGMDSIDHVIENSKIGDDFHAPTQADLDDIEKDKEIWKGAFCRRCGYCKPCSAGLDIPTLLLIEGYYSRYDLKQWALDRLSVMSKIYSDCTACGQCLSRCPYHLPIDKLMAKAAKTIL